MAITLKQDEAVPTYPATPTGLSVAAAAINAAVIWTRIEAYVSARWTARAVVWTVEGPGEWVPILTPATITLTEKWTGTAWAADTPPASPLGGYALADATFRLTGTVGGGTVPEAVKEAFRRLAEYLAEDPKTRGTNRESYSVGPINIDFRRDPAWLGAAMINSGAADLLRPYRRAA